MPINRREALAAASALMIYPPFAAAATPVPERIGAGRQRLDDGWKFAFGHLTDLDRDFGFGLFQRTFAKQGPEWANPNQPPDGARATLPEFDDSSWRRLDLPHDWAVELPFVDQVAHSRRSGGKEFVWDDAAGHGFKPVGRDYPETSVGWYRRFIELGPEDHGKRIRIDFDGVLDSAFVMFNGYILAEHRGGYLPFSVDVTDFINTDGKPNILTVRVDASLGEGWFYEGAGIYRHVWLAKQNPVHIVRDGICIRPKTDGQVDILATVVNASDRVRAVQVRSAVRGAPAGEALVAVELQPWEQRDIALATKLAQPRLWSLDDPYLYDLQTQIEDRDNGVQDRSVVSFGFRDVRFDPDQGFFLNGKSIKIKGTANHQDHAGVGAAVPDAIWNYRLQCLKDMGCNAIRTAHNPPAPELLDACDRMGFLVLDEARLMTSSERGLDELRTMVIRDRNHPSIILWSIGNEEPQQGTKRGLAIGRTMKRLVQDMDPTRGITVAMNDGQGEGVTEIVDVMGFNYADDKIDAFHEKFPKLPIIGSETASAVATRGEYFRDDVRRVVPAYDTPVKGGGYVGEQWWSHFNARPFIGGGFFWTGFDYRGEPTPWQELPSISSHFGVLDMCGFPKDGFYYYQAWWQEKPVLHLFPHWNWEPGQSIRIWAHSNCDSVELFVNGKSAGRQTMKKDSHLEWPVDYAPGNIQAFGYKGDKVIVKSVRETAGPAARILLTADRSAIDADGCDCAVMKASIVDAKGIPVPRANNLLTFSTFGGARIVGVGNGDPNCHEADRGSQRSAFNGLACAIIQSPKAAGIGLVTATADGLLAGKATLKFN